MVRSEERGVEWGEGEKRRGGEWGGRGREREREKDREKGKNGGPIEWLGARRDGWSGGKGRREEGESGEGEGEREREREREMCSQPTLFSV